MTKIQALQAASATSPCTGLNQKDAVIQQLLAQDARVAGSHGPAQQNSLQGPKSGASLLLPAAPAD